MSKLSLEGQFNEDMLYKWDEVDKKNISIELKKYPKYIDDTNFINFLLNKLMYEHDLFRISEELIEPILSGISPDEMEEMCKEEIEIIIIESNIEYKDKIIKLEKIKSMISFYERKISEYI